MQSVPQLKLANLNLNHRASSVLSTNRHSNGTNKPQSSAQPSADVNRDARGMPTNVRAIDNHPAQPQPQPQQPPRQRTSASPAAFSPSTENGSSSCHSSDTTSSPHKSNQTSYPTQSTTQHTNGVNN